MNDRLRPVTLSTLILAAVLAQADPLVPAARPDDAREAPGTGLLPRGYNPGEYFHSRSLDPAFRDAQGHRLSVPQVSDYVATGFDFVARTAFISAANTRSLDVQSSTAYVGFGKSFVVMSLAVPTAPAIVGWVDLPETISSISYVAGAHAYATGQGSLYAVNVSTPSTPTLAGTLALGTTLDVAYPGGSHVHVAGGSFGLRIVDVSTPTAPTLAGTLNTPGSAAGVFISGNRAYVADGASGLQIIDITAPAAPVLLGTLDTAGTANDVTVNGTTAYVTDGFPSPALRVIDASNPAAPTLSGSAVLASDGRGVACFGTTVYVAGNASGLVIVNASVPTSPVVIGTYATTGAASAVDVVGSRVAVLEGTGLRVVEASVPSAPTLLGSYQSVGALVDVAVEGNFQYLASPSGLYVVDITLPQRPRVRSLTPSAGSVLGMTARDGLVYLAVGSAGLRIYDVSNPSAPAILSTFDTPGNAEDVTLSGDLAYVSDGTGGVRIVDVSSPAAPVLVGSFDTAGTARATHVVGTHAYVADYSNGLVILDVSNPAAPALLSTTAFFYPAEGIWVSNGRAYVGTGLPSPALVGVLEILDVSSPASPGLLSDTSIGFGPGYDIRVLGTVCYVTADLSGLKVYDVSSPYAPTEVASFVESGIVGVDVENGYAHVTTTTSGAFMLHYTAQCYESYEPNNYASEAWPVAAGAAYDAKICSATDTDYYALTTATGGTLSVDMHPPGGQDYDLFLYDAAGVLVDASMTAGSASENVGAVLTSGGTYRMLVRGHDGSQFSASLYYTLVPGFTPCAAIPNAVYLYPAPTLDANGNVVLHIQDPNQGSVVTGYNVYRATAPGGPFTLRAGNVTDMDGGTPNVQFADVGSNVGGPYYYNVTAVNGTCGSEGP